MTDPSRLSRTRIAAYTLPAIPLSALSIPLGVYIPPLYAGDTSLTLVLVGTLLLVSRCLDIVTDPLFGLISDRLRPRLGRRRTWLLISTPLLMLSVHMLFHPPEGAGVTYFLIWIGCVYLGFTFAFLSHLSWGAELSPHYDDRSRVLGWRELVVTLGTLFVLVLPTLGELTGEINTAAARADLISNFVVISLPICFGISALMVPDPLPETATDKSARANLKTAITNPHLPRLLIADVLFSTALGITGALFIWLAEHVLHQERFTSLFLLVYFGGAAACVPVWIHLAVKYEKHVIFSAAMAYGVATLMLFALTPQQSVGLILIVHLLYGFAFGAGSFLVRALMADIADHDALEHGTHRVGTFFAGLTLTAKFGFAFGPFAAYFALNQFGFDPKTETITEAASNGLLITFITLPVLCFACAGLIMRNYKLTRAKHSDIRKALEARHT